MKKKIIVGQISLSFHVSAASVVVELLKKVGYTVEVVSDTHENMFKLLGEKKVDILISAWLPYSHGKYIQAYEDNLIKYSVLYNPYCIWGVSSNAPNNITSISDIALPDNAKIFNKHIQGINEGAGISRFSRQILKEYGLEEYGFNFSNGSVKDCTDAFLKAEEKGEFVIIPLWHPQYLHHSIKIRELDDPKGLLRGQDDATILVRSEVDSLLCSKARKILREVTLGNKVVSYLDYYLSIEGLSAEQVGVKWIEENNKLCDSWLA